MSLARLADVAVEDYAAVHRHPDAVAHGVDFHRIPRPELAEYDTLRRNNPVNGTVLW